MLTFKIDNTHDRKLNKSNLEGSIIKDTWIWKMIKFIRNLNQK